MTALFQRSSKILEGKLTQLTVELFEAFSGMEKLKVQSVIENKQGAAELTAKDHVVNF